MPDVIADLDRDEKEQKARITPEMIEAGETELVFYEPGESYAAECVAEIYAAMEAARLQGLRKT